MKVQEKRRLIEELDDFVRPFAVDPVRNLPPRRRGFLTYIGKERNALAELAEGGLVDAKPVEVGQGGHALGRTAMADPGGHGREEPRRAMWHIATGCSLMGGWDASA